MRSAQVMSVSPTCWPVVHDELPGRLRVVAADLSSGPGEDLVAQCDVAEGPVRVCALIGVE